MKLSDDTAEKIKTAEKIRRRQEQIEIWINGPFKKTRTIEPWKRIKKEEFDNVIVRLIACQIESLSGYFEGGSDLAGDMPYGLIKFREPYLLKPWAEGIVVIYEKDRASGLLGGKVGVLGFGVDPATNELVGISLYAGSPGFVERHLGKKGGGFYFGSTENTVPNPEDVFNDFVIPTGKMYGKYFEIVKSIWANYRVSV